ncbi:hypothetical protein VPH35_126072 [Triticum aestivum]
MDAVESSSSSPYSPPSLRHKLRTTICVCFGSPSSPGSGGERPHAGGGRSRWRRRVTATEEFRYDPLSYALNLDDGSSDDGDLQRLKHTRTKADSMDAVESSTRGASRAVAIA